MKVAKSHPFAVLRNEDAYQIYETIEGLHAPGVDPIIELCVENFELFTGVVMDVDEVALVTLNPKRIVIEETKMVLFKKS